MVAHFADAHRQAGALETSFYKAHIDIDWNVIQMYDMEIMNEGKKQKVQHGEFRIEIRGYLEMPEMLVDTKILRFFDNWFKTRLLKKNLEGKQENGLSGRLQPSGNA